MPLLLGGACKGQCHGELVATADGYSKHVVFPRESSRASENGGTNAAADKPQRIVLGYFSELACCFARGGWNRDGAWRVAHFPASSGFFVGRTIQHTSGFNAKSQQQPPADNCQLPDGGESIVRKIRRTA